MLVDSGNEHCSTILDRQVVVFWALKEERQNVDSSRRGDREYQVNKQDFLQVFQGSGIGNMEDNLTSAGILYV